MRESWTTGFQYRIGDNERTGAGISTDISKYVQESSAQFHLNYSFFFYGPQISMDVPIHVLVRINVSRPPLTVEASTNQPSPGLLEMTLTARMPDTGKEVSYTYAPSKALPPRLGVSVPVASTQEPRTGRRLQQE